MIQFMKCQGSSDDKNTENADSGDTNFSIGSIAKDLVDPFEFIKKITKILQWDNWFFYYTKICRNILFFENKLCLLLGNIFFKFVIVISFQLLILLKFNEATALSFPKQRRISSFENWLDFLRHASFLRIFSFSNFKAIIILKMKFWTCIM